MKFSGTIFRYRKISHDMAEFNGETFKDARIELKAHCITAGIDNLVFIMDNARNQHYRDLFGATQENEINILHLPPYSPFLNPIENVFSICKDEVNRSNSMTESMLWQAITSTFRN